MSEFQMDATNVLLILLLVGLFVYFQRINQSLLALLGEYAAQLKIIAGTLEAIERRIEHLEWGSFGQRGQPITLTQSQTGERASVGQAAVGSGHSQAQPSNAVNSSGVRVGSE